MVCFVGHVLLIMAMWPMVSAKVARMNQGLGSW